MNIKVSINGKTFEIDTDRVKANLIDFASRYGGSIILKVTDIANEGDSFEWIELLRDNGLTIWLVIQKK